MFIDQTGYRISIPMEKKMAGVHFGTIPYEPYTAHKVQGNPYFCKKKIQVIFVVIFALVLKT